MNIDGIPTRTLRAHPAQNAIDIIDQTRLPHALHWARVSTLEEAAHAIRAMQVRGAPLIGATAAYGLAIALEFEASDRRLAEAAALLRSTRPTAVNLHWALARMESVVAAAGDRKPATRLPGRKPPRLPMKTWRKTPPSASMA